MNEMTIEGNFQQNKEPKFWGRILLLFLFPIAGMALGVATTMLLKIDQTKYGDLVINLFFLAACLGLLPVFKFSSKELGLKIIKEQVSWHVTISLVIFVLYMLFYIFVIRISGLRPLSAEVAWGLLSFLIVALAEEYYFRGILYGFIEKRFSARTALIVTSIVFGLFHARQGLTGILSRTFTGWLWGSVRYSSGMIFLLIFPIHFAYNSIWLLFEGNWNNPPAWAIYALPTVEFLLGMVIITISNRRTKMIVKPDKSINE